MRKKLQIEGKSYMCKKSWGTGRLMRQGARKVNVQQYVLKCQKILQVVEKLGSIAK